MKKLVLILLILTLVTSCCTTASVTETTREVQRDSVRTEKKVTVQPASYKQMEVDLLCDVITKKVQSFKYVFEQDGDSTIVESTGDKMIITQSQQYRELKNEYRELNIKYTKLLNEKHTVEQKIDYTGYWILAGFIAMCGGMLYLQTLKSPVSTASGALQGIVTWIKSKF